MKLSLHLTALLFAGSLLAESPLHSRIDSELKKSTPDAVLAPVSTDAEFFRRAHLDFVGDIPTVKNLRAFLADKNPNKRTKAIDALLADPRHPAHMADQFAILLMERRGENPHWRKWLEESFSKNKPWDQIVREIIRADHRDEPNRGAAFFYTKRLEKYGANAIDYPGLTRDVGRLFLGVDLQCAECHNHRTVDSYKQLDFQGMHSAFLKLKLVATDVPTVEEQITEAPLEFASVFNQRKKTTSPRIPGLEEITVQTFEKEEAYLVPPDKKTKTLGIPRYSPLTEFADQLPDSPTFAPNIANRLWFHMIGRGIVEPLDLFHPENPPTHPALLQLLSDDLVKQKYDLKNFLREIALTEAYQRSSKYTESGEPVNLSDQKFTAAVERRLSAEQIHCMILTATGNTAESLGEEPAEELRKKVMESFTGEPREPELEWTASLKGTLLFLNDPEFATLFSPQKDNLASQLVALKDPAKITERLFFQIYSRAPSAEEVEETVAFLIESPSSPESVTDLVWAMLTSTEFFTNH